MIRWLLWNLRCFRGRHCAHLEVDGLDGPAIIGAVLEIRYRCGGCGTVYLTSTLIGQEGDFTQAERVRV